MKKPTLQRIQTLRRSRSPAVVIHHIYGDLNIILLPVVLIFKNWRYNARFTGMMIFQEKKGAEITFLRRSTREGRGAADNRRDGGKRSDRSPRRVALL
jgi:hypothetical protein